MIKPNNSKENKIKNRVNVLKMLMLYAPVSRIELSKRTGLSKMTLTNIINEFREEKIVEETEKDTSTSSGRKPIMLTLTDHGIVGIGVYISRRNIRGCVVSMGGTILNQVKQPLANGETSQSLMEKISITVESLLKTIHSAKIAGIGIASIGPLNIHDGLILSPPDFYGIKNVPVKNMLEEKFGLPTYLENDMNVSVLAEKYFGHAKENKDFIYLGVTNGIGSGIMVNNRLLLGNMGFAGEIGHTTIHYGGKECLCGQKGCLEQYADCRAVVNEAKELFKDRPDITYEEITKGLLEGDVTCKKLIEKQCKYLSYAIVNLINLFDPECIILGHDIAYSEDFAIQNLQKQIKGKPLIADYKETPILLSKFYDKAPLIGSATLAFDKYLQ